MQDVVIAGAGPAGSIAALLLARAGARVLIVDRESFPRDKLCGDTLNPGALRWLASVGLGGGPLPAARALRGMRVSGPRLTIETRYGGDVEGRALTRRVLDAWLLDEAIRAGARFESGWVVRRALVADGHPQRVRGLYAERGGRGLTGLPAPITIAADGRRSAIAFDLKLVRHPARPRRWAFGVYAAGIRDTSDVGEMHVRSGSYLGIAPLTDELSNVCFVAPRPAGPTPLDHITSAIARDPHLTERFAHARFVGDVRVLGPLAVDADAAGAEGLLLAGDAAGFIDPMTGDGLNLALRGGALAADEALRALSTGDFAGAPRRLAAARAVALGAKIRFNRVLRTLVSSGLAIHAAQAGSFVAPGLLRRVVRHAGDVA